MDRARVEALLTSIETLIGCVRGEMAVEPEPEPTPTGCPSCGETSDEKLEDTTPGGEAKRITCKSCGKSWRP